MFRYMLVSFTDFCIKHSKVLLISLGWRWEGGEGDGNSGYFLSPLQKCKAFRSHYSHLLLFSSNLLLHGNSCQSLHNFQDPIFLLFILTEITALQFHLASHLRIHFYNKFKYLAFFKIIIYNSVSQLVKFLVAYFHILCHVLESSTKPFSLRLLITKDYACLLYTSPSPRDQA